MATIEGDVFGIVSARQEERKKWGRHEYQAPVILTAKSPEMQTPDVLAKIEKRKQEILSELIEAEARKRAEAAYIAQTAPVCPIADIVAACSEITGISIDDMRGPRRSRHLAWPRHFTIWMIRRLRWDMSMPMIAKLMGNRDHTTVLHAVRNVEKRRGEIDAPFAGWIEDPRAQALLSRKAAQ